MTTRKKTILLTILILLLLAIVLGTWCGLRKIKKDYFQPIKNDNGRINILLLGINNVSGAEKDLTDTIILASFDRQKQKVTLISMPRDLWIEEIKAKINTAYHYRGIEFAKRIVNEVLGQNIHYYAVVNFDSFERIINFLGGVEVKVGNTFDDYQFPIPGKEKDLCNGDRLLRCRYEHLHFDAGNIVMNGLTALKFVRSRNAIGVEGTDFARSRRQQQVLLAIKDKIFNPDFYKQPKLVWGLLTLLQQEIKTDVKPTIYGSLAILGYQIAKKGILAEEVNITDNLLIHPKYHYSKQWVLLPKSGGWEEVQLYLENLLK